jgi:hypothetical protein
MNTLKTNAGIAVSLAKKHIVTNNVNEQMKIN